MKGYSRKFIYIKSIKPKLEYERIETFAHINLGVSYNFKGMSYTDNDISYWTKEEILEFALQNLKDINTTVDHFGDSLLHNSIGFGDPELVKNLIRLGADPNKKGQNGETPIYVAVRTKNKEMVDALITLGAKVKVGNDQSETPIAVAEHFGYDSSHELYILLTNKIKGELKIVSDQYIEIANQYIVEDKYEEALNNYGYAIQYCYYSDNAFYLRGRVYLKMGNLELAKADFINAVKYGSEKAKQYLSKNFSQH